MAKKRKRKQQTKLPKRGLPEKWWDKGINPVTGLKAATINNTSTGIPTHSLDINQTRRK